jgi:UDP-N-acetylmuramyl pentapeptide phosphotransferase/UDP-N-acetylglucosamine-1-phosphate transferase
MAQKPLTELTTEELKTKEKQLKTVCIIMGVFIVLMFLIGGFLTSKQGPSVFTVMPIAFLAILIGNIGNLRKVQKEIALRNA